MTFGRRFHGIDWGLAAVASCLDLTVAVWFVAVGASIGSFLNVVAYRLPLGRNIGGHSSCPYCRTPIDGTDNVPVLAWVKLRGRCRACRLPISAQYPLVELAVAIIFLLVYVTEFSTNAANLPGIRSRAMGIGLMRVAMTPEFILRITVYLFALSGLLGAALIAVKKRTVPLRLYLWSLAPLALAAGLLPSVVIVRWREAEPVGEIEARLDAMVTIICGSVAGIAMARLLAPLLYQGFDRSLMASDPASRGARQFVGAMGLAGAVLGWQSVVPMAWILMACALIAVGLLARFRSVACLSDMTVWVGLGLLVFRAGWSDWTSLQPFPSSVSEVWRHVLGALLLAPLAMVFRRLAMPTRPPAEKDRESDVEAPLAEEEDELESPSLQTTEQNPTDIRSKRPT